jgi:hypothetical protein
MSLKNDYLSRDINFTPFICFHVIGDEANLILRFWVLLTEILNKCLRFLEILILLPIFLFFIIILIKNLGSIDIGYVSDRLAIISWSIHNGTFDNEDRVRYLEAFNFYVVLSFIFFPLVLFIIYLLTTPLVLLIPWYLRRQFFGFGNEGLMGNFGSDIHVNRTPHPRSTIELCIFALDLLKGKLRHSRFTKSKSVLEKTSQYISSNAMDELTPSYNSSSYVSDALSIISYCLISTIVWFEMFYMTGLFFNSIRLNIGSWR